MPDDGEIASPPSGLPQSITDGMQRQNEDTLVDILSYSRDLIHYLQNPPEQLTEEGEQLVESDEGDETWTRVVKRVPCGKNCSGCPHGPYLYLVRRVTVDRLEWKYVGKAGADADQSDEEEYPDEEGTPEEDEEDSDESALEGGTDDSEPVYPDQNDGEGDDSPYPDQ